MTINELIEELKKYDGELRVVNLVYWENIIVSDVFIDSKQERCVGIG